MNNPEIVYGIRAIIEVIESGKQVEKILLKKQFKSELLKQLRQLAHQHGIPVQYVPVEKLNKITRQNHQGAIAFVSPIIFWELDDLISQTYEKGQIPLIIILDRVTDVHNFGAILRTAECTGATGVIIPLKNTAQISGGAMKTSAGALNYIPIVRMPLNKAVDDLKTMGFRILAASEKGTSYIYEKDMTAATAIIMGSEEKGISTELMKKAHDLVKIPILGRIESLNVSVAASIFLYEAMRQRIEKGIISLKK